MKTRRALALRILTGFATLIVILTVAVAGLGWWVYRHPQAAYAVAEKYFLPKDLKISWDDIKFSGTHLGGVDFRIDLSVRDLKIEKADPSVSFPIDQLQISASVFPLQRRADLHNVEAIATKDLIFRQSPNEKPAPAKNPFEYVQDVVSILRLIHAQVPIKSLHAKAAAFTYQPLQGEPFTLAVELIKDRAQQENVESPLNFQSAFKLKGTTIVDIDAKGVVAIEKIESPESFLQTEIKIRGKTFEETAQTGSFDADIRLTAQSEAQTTRFALTGPIEYRREGTKKLRLRLNPKLQLTMNDHEAQTLLKTGIDGIPGPLVKVDPVEVSIRTPLESGLSWSTKPSAFEVTAPIALFFVDRTRRAQMEKACACELPEVIKTEAKGQIWLSSLFDPPTAAKETAKTLADLKITAENLQNKVFSVNLATDLKIEKASEKIGDPSANTYQTIYRFFPHLDCTATVRSFQSIKPLLDANGILIPAPFDVLDGTLDFKANGPVATEESGSRFPLALEIDLTSRSQRMKVSTEASILLNSRFTEANFDIKARIADLFLDLPPLDPLKGMPRVTPDSRFKKTPVPKAKPSKFKLSFNFEVETTGGSGIRLASRYFRPYLPLNIQVRSNGRQDNSGYIDIGTFDVTYLRRTVRVEGLRLNLDGSEGGDFPMKGRLRIKQTQYTVFIDIEGTAKNPSMTMSSEPYLPKNEIISVLLYDRTSDQLVSGDAETAGGVQAAIADRAIGLFGLWAFATTPIKSFSYNPVTKVYTATIAVSDDTTAGIGTDWEAAARLELRKRISRRWSLTAAWTPATPEEAATSKLVLQWEKRF